MFSLRSPKLMMSKVRKHIPKILAELKFMSIKYVEMRSYIQNIIFGID